MEIYSVQLTKAQIEAITSALHSVIDEFEWPVGSMKDERAIIEILEAHLK